MQFSINDYVCTPGGGLGRISQIEKLYGEDYYVIVNELGIVRKPTTTDDTSLREPTDETAVRQALTQLERKPLPLPRFNHDKQNYVEVVLEENCLASAVQLLGQLYVPPDQERSWFRLEYYEKVLQIVASEVAHVLGHPRQRMRGYLEASIADRRLVPELQEPSP